MQQRGFVGLSLQLKSIEKIDEKRGLVTRSRFVDNIIENALKDDEDDQSH